MDGKAQVDSTLADARVSVRTQLAVLWICHFILWIFGDMFTLLQDIGEPTTQTWVLVVAPSTAILLVSVVAYTLIGRPGPVRLATLIVAPVYLVFDVGFLVDATQGWEYYLGLFYVVFSVLVILRAWTWPRTDSGT